MEAAPVPCSGERGGSRCLARGYDGSWRVVAGAVWPLERPGRCHLARTYLPEPLFGSWRPPRSRRAAEFLLTRSRGERGGVLSGPGCVLRGAERSSPGSTFMMNVVPSGGIRAHPAGEGAGRGRLHPANADPPGANHTITESLITPRGLRSARDPEATLCALRTSALSAPPREPLMLRAS